MNAKLQRAQEAYDAMVPDDSLPWSSSTEWANIHYCAVDDLIQRGQVRFAGVLLVEADILCIKVQDAAEKAIKQDHECYLAQAVVAAENNDISEVKRLLRCFIGKDTVRDIAGDLVNAKQDEIYRLYMAAQEAA